MINITPKKSDISIEFEDIVSLLVGHGSQGAIGLGRATGQNCLIKATELALANTRVGDRCKVATGAILHICGHGNLSLLEVSKSVDVLRQALSEDVEIIFGTAVDDSLGDEVVVTVMLTGYDE